MSCMGEGSSLRCMQSSLRQTEDQWPSCKSHYLTVSEFAKSSSALQSSKSLHFNFTKKKEIQLNPLIMSYITCTHICQNSICLCCATLSTCVDSANHPTDDAT